MAAETKGSSPSNAAPEDAVMGGAKLVEEVAKAAGVAPEEKPKVKIKREKKQEKDEAEKQAKEEPKSQPQESAVARAKITPREEFEQKLDTTAKTVTGGKAESFAACTIKDKIQVLQKQLGEAPDEQSKVLLKYLQKIDHLYEQQEQKIIEKIEWEQAKAELKSVKREELPAEHQPVLDRTHQEVFNDVAADPKKYGVETPEQAKDVAQALDRSSLAQYRKSQKEAGPQPEKTDVQKAIETEKRKAEVEHDKEVGKQAIDRLAHPKGDFSDLPEAKEIIQGASEVEALTVEEAHKRIEDAVKAYPEEAKEDGKWIADLASEVKENASVASHLAAMAEAGPEAINDPNYVFVKGAEMKMDGNDPLLLDPASKSSAEANRVLGTLRDKVEKIVESDPKQYETFKNETTKTEVEALMEFHGEHGMPTIPPADRSDFYIDEAKIDALPEITLDQRLYKQFLRDVNVLLGNKKQVELSTTNFRDNIPYYEKVSDLMYTYTTEFMDSHFVSDVEFQTQMGLLVKEGAAAIEAANDRGWSDLYLSPRIMKQAHENIEYLLVRLEDQIREVPSFFENDVKQAIGHLKAQISKYGSHEDYKAHRIAYVMNPNNHARIKELSGEAVDPNNPSSHPWIQEMINNEKHQAFVTRINHMSSDAESLQFSYTNFLAGGNLERGQASASNLSEAGIWRIYTGRGGVNMYVHDTIARHGWNIKWETVNGDRRVIAGVAFDEMVQQATDEIWAHRVYIEDKFEKFANRSLTISDVRAAVKEAFILKVVTGERAEYVMNGLLPTEINGASDLTNPAAFAGQTPDYSWIQAIDPVRGVEFRWRMVEDAVAVRYKTMAYNEAARSDIDIDIREEMRHIRRGTPEFEEKARRAFNIVTGGSEKNALSDLHVLRCGEAKPKPIPASIADLSEEDLTNWMIFKQGLSLAGQRLTGGYTESSAGWNNETLVNISHHKEFQALFKGGLKKSFVHERLRGGVGSLITARTHEDVVESKKNLTSFHLSPDVDPEGEGALVTLGRVDPISTCQALEEVQDSEFSKFFNQHAEAGEYDIFHDEIPRTDGKPVYREDTTKITKKRFDLFVKRFTMRHQLIDHRLAGKEIIIDGKVVIKEPEGPMDYSLSLEDAKATSQWATLRQVCIETKVDPEEYYGRMHSISVFALREDVLKRAASPMVSKYWTTVHYRDPRLRYVDDEAYKGPHWSVVISQQDPSTASGIGRMYGDCNTAKDGYKAFNQAIGASDEKMFHEATYQFVNTIKFVGGRDCKIMTTQMMYYAWGLPGLMDLKYDLAGVDPHNVTFPTSAAQRAGGHAQSSMRRNQFEEFIHKGEGTTNTVWHNWSPHVTHAIEKRNKLVLSVEWPGFVQNLADKTKIKIIQRIFHKEIAKVKVISLYRMAGLSTLAAGVLALGIFQETQKGLSGDDSGGGGGGHHP